MGYQTCQNGARVGSFRFARRISRTVGMPVSSGKKITEGIDTTFQAQLALFWVANITGSDVFIMT